MSAANINDLRLHFAFEQRHVRRNHILDIGIVATDVQVAEFNELRALPEVLHDLGNQKMISLPTPGVIEGTSDQYWKPSKPSSNQLLHRELAAGIMADWRWTERFLQYFDRGRPVNIGATGDHNPGGRAIKPG